MIDSGNAIPLTTVLTSNACNTFRKQNEEQQRKLWPMASRKQPWRDGGLPATLLEPFEQMHRSNQLSHTKQNATGGSGRDLII
jgi:hypothetical protein